MPEDTLRPLFDQVAQLDVPVPPTALVRARGRQRRRRAALMASAGGLAVLAVAGLGASQVAGLIPSPWHAGPAFGTASGRPAAHDRNGTAAGGKSGQPLPPAGRGQLVLGLTVSGRFVMTRVSAPGAPVQVPGLRPVAGGPSLLITNPAGGWVITFTTNPRAAYGSQPARLATLSPTGRSEPFGPVFVHQAVTSAAVSPDGSRVAVVLIRPAGGPASIEVLAMPGHGTRERTWTIPLAQANFAASLSWAPDGRRLSYIAGEQTGAGVTGGPETLDVTAPGSAAPGVSAWPSAGKSPGTCVPDAAAWLGASGRFAAVEECTAGPAGPAHGVLQRADAGTGASRGHPVVIAGHAGCGSGSIDSTGSGERVLIGYCGHYTYLDDNGRLASIPGALTAAALAG